MKKNYKGKNLILFALIVVVGIFATNSVFSYVYNKSSNKQYSAKSSDTNSTDGKLDSETIDNSDSDTDNKLLESDEDPYKDVPQMIVYRLYNKESDQYYLTAREGEYDQLVSYGWEKQGPVFKVYTKLAGGLDPIFRVYNEEIYGGDHFYTKSYLEAEEYRAKEGWRSENDGKPICYTYGDYPVYRLYNPINTRHYYTCKEGEYNNLINAGWEGEGEVFTVSSYYTNNGWVE